MTVNITLHEPDALACFPSVIPWPWIQGQIKSSPPSVKWLVVAEPLVCPTCDGLGQRSVDDHGNIWGNTLASAMGLTLTIDCPDCNGTGLPDVEILTTGPELTEYEAGVVTIGAAAQIEHTSQGHVFLRGCGPIPIDQFGGQAVTPEHYAHPILSSPDGTDAATPAA